MNKKRLPQDGIMIENDKLKRNYKALESINNQLTDHIKSLNNRIKTLDNELTELLEKGRSSDNLMDFYNKLKQQYKVITMDGVLSISRKYKLCIAKTDQFASDVPVKNIKDIQAFSMNYQTLYGRRLDKDKLFICAPKNDFIKQVTYRNQFLVENGSIIKLEDPIVLYPADNTSYGDFRSTNYFYIVTAWGGPEASDPLVVNQKNN